jgi:hypothetical protein
MKINYLLTLLVLIFMVVPVSVPATATDTAIAYEIDVGAGEATASADVYTLTSVTAADELSAVPFTDMLFAGEMVDEGWLYTEISKPPEFNAHLTLIPIKTFNTAVYRHRLQYARSC